MTLNLNMEPSFIVETMGLQWLSELTFAENVPVLMKQFKKERGLKPFKVKFNVFLRIWVNICLSKLIVFHFAILCNIP